MSFGEMVTMELNREKAVAETKSSAFGLLEELRKLGFTAPALMTNDSDISKIEIVWRANGECYVKVSNGHLLNAFHYDNIVASPSKKRGSRKYNY